VDESAGNGSKQVDESSPAGIADLQREPNLTISESELLLDPFRTLDEIVRNGKGLVEETIDGANTQIVGDPFDPRSHEALKNAQRSPYEGKKEKIQDESVKSKADHASIEGAAPGPEGLAEGRRTGEESGGGPEKPDVGSSVKASQLEKAQANALRGEIEEIHAQYKGVLDVDVSVQVTDDGILVAIEDRKKGSMFAVGSAVPGPVLVEFIGKVGAALAKLDSPVVVRGHTDARQFANKLHDNWQLSTARAHISSYMLMRGGLPERRLARIEGFGSAKLLVPEDPLADANRRVEFLLLHK
jgi:chemotaxis protein MotB